MAKKNLFASAPVDNDPSTLTPVIKQIKVGETNYYLDAVNLIDAGGTEHSYEEIKELISRGLQIKVVDKLPTIENTKAFWDANSGILFLIAEAGSKTGTYVEYVLVNRASTGYDLVFEKIGTTETDLSDYAKKSEAAKAATYTTTAPSTDATGSTDLGTASGSATVTYSKADSKTGAAGADTVTAAAAGAVTVSGSNFGFAPTTKTVTVNVTKKSGVSIADTTYTPEGTITISGGSTTPETVLTGVTAELAATPTFSGKTATLTVAAGITGTAVDAHSYTPEGSITGSQSIAAHSHTVNVASSTATFISSVDGTTGSEGNHAHDVDSHEHAADVTVVTNVAADGTANAITGISAPTATFTITGTAADTKGVKVDTSAADTTPVVINTTNAETGTVGLTYTKQALSGDTSFMKTATVNNGVLSWTDGTVGITDGACALTGDKTFAKSGLATASCTQSFVASAIKSAALAEDTSASAAFKFNTNAIKAASSTAAFVTSVAASSTASVLRGVKVSGTTTAAGASSAKTLTAKTAGAHSHSIGSDSASITYVTSATLATDGAATVDFTKAGFSGTAATLAHNVTQGTFTTTVSYKPEGDVSKPSITVTPATTSVIKSVGDLSATFNGTTATLSAGTITDAIYEASFANADIAGSITGSQAIADHTHSVTIADHTHAIGSTPTSVTGTAAVAVGAHTHTLSGHTHNVTLDNCL